MATPREPWVLNGRKAGLQVRESGDGARARSKGSLNVFSEGSRRHKLHCGRCAKVAGGTAKGARGRRP